MAITDADLKPLTDLTGFICGAIYSGEGIPMAYIGKSNIDKEEFAGYAIQLYKRAVDFSNGLSVGSPEFVEIHTDEVIFVHICIIPGVAAVGVMIDKEKGTVGLARFKLRQIAAKTKTELA